MHPLSMRTPPIRRSAFVLSLLLGLVAFVRHGVAIGEDALLARAKALHAKVPLIDGHNDYPWALRERVPSLDLAALDIRGSQPKLMTDIPRLRAGGVGGQFWSVYVPAISEGRTAVRSTLEQIDIVGRMTERYPQDLELARTADDVERIFHHGKIASMIGVEGGHSIDSSLGTLRMLRALGASYMTLTHTRNTPWADSATDTAVHGGLTAFGELVVTEMNRLGMLVDLSHVSPDTMADALRVSQAPVIFSHSCARALSDVPRNVPDDILRQLRTNGGVVMVAFAPSFLSPEGSAHYAASLAETKRLEQAYPDDPTERKKQMEAFNRLHPAPKATLAMAADHIDHIRKVAGIDHIGIGSDFDGIEAVPQGLEDVSKYPALTAELLRRGYSEADVSKILGGNILRVMREAERVSAGMHLRPPATPSSEDTDRTPRQEGQPRRETGGEGEPFRHSRADAVQSSATREVLMRTSDVAALTAISEAIASAIERRDLETVAGHLGPDFVHRTPGGESRDRAGFLEGLKGIPGDIELVRVHDLQIDVVGDSAIVCGTQQARVKVDGRVVEEHRAFVDYFTRIEGTWKLRTAVDLPAVGS